MPVGIKAGVSDTRVNLTLRKTTEDNGLTIDRSNRSSAQRISLKTSEKKFQAAEIAGFQRQRHRCRRDGGDA